MRGESNECRVYSGIVESRVIAGKIARCRCKFRIFDTYSVWTVAYAAYCLTDEHIVIKLS